MCCGAIQSYSRKSFWFILQVIDGYQTLAKMILYLLAYVIKPLKHVSQAVISEVFYIQWLLYHSRQGLNVFISPSLNLNHTMIRLRDNVSEPCSSQPSDAQSLMVAVRIHDFINSILDTHLFEESKQNGYIVNTFCMNI